ncbi:ATP-binding cassette domain-containing protein [Bradyrhizobium ontarionense]|uniref:ATP-binding cassette domain-containing protein n=1 Tax=Bradyrhizobium ontarionense TaxID=2898149 RepID=A0ABY3R797_9BRAD|nr:ATP-binding cassette domain-containing protein [Bradyrhizobium sp. A19]UFZ02647.1 ATP-binding cassette domain-containing protein [Bradyrhizobium sp. A19]
MTRETDLLIVERLSVTDRDGRTLISNFDLHLGEGAVHVILGETGAGKSIVCAAIAGTLPAELATSGSVVLGGRELTRLTGRQRRALWSRDLFLLPQEPWNALAQTRTLQRQIADMPRLFDGADRRRAGLVAQGLLQRFGLSPVMDGSKLPCDISGGMAQRASIATALASPARLILVDEPTKGLDAACREEIAEALLVLASEGRSIIAVTHDLSFARMLGGTLSVLRDGGVVETGPTADVLQAPRSAYLRDLVNAEPSRWPHRRYAPSQTILELDRGTISVGDDRRPLITDLSLAARAGEIVGLCGPSGCGKTTLGNVLLKLAVPAAGQVTWSLSDSRRYQKIYQNPGAAFAPWRTIGATVRDALDHANDRGPSLSQLLHSVGVAASILERRPHQVSGGELQRISLVRALLCSPAFIFADEPTSRLDVVTQRKIMDLLADVAIERKIAVVLVSHDADLIDRMTERSITIHPLDRPAPLGVPQAPRSMW